MLQIAWYTTIVLGTLTGLVAIWQFKMALGILVFSLAFAAAFRPLVEFFVQHGISRYISALLSYLGVISVLIGLILVIDQPFFNELQQGTDDFLTAYERYHIQWTQGETQFDRFLAEQLPPTQAIYEALTEEQLAQFTQTILGIALNTLEIGGNLTIVLILSMYWSVDRIRFERLWLSLLPVQHRSQARMIWRATKDGIGSYIRSEFLQSLWVGILLGLGYWTMGLPYPILLALQASIIRLIPWVGGILAGIVPLAVGLSVGPLEAVIVVLLTGFVQLIVKIFLRRFLFDHREYSSLLLLLVTIALAYSFGLVGAMIGPLLAITLQILFRYLYQFYMPLFNGNLIVKETGLTKQLETIQETAAEVNPVLSPEARSLLDRLSKLVVNAGEFLNEQNSQPESSNYQN